MHWINIGLLIVAGLNLGMALMVLFLNPKNKINISFSVSLFFLATWAFGVGMFREAINDQTAIYWTWLFNGSGSVVVASFFVFSCYFPYQKFRFNLRMILALFMGLILMIMIVTIPNIFVAKILFSPPRNSYLLNPYGILAYSILFYTYLSLAFVNFFKKYIYSSGFMKKQLRYVMVGTGIVASFGSLEAVMLPLFAGRLTSYYWVSPFFSIPMILILSYFILRSR